MTIIALATDFGEGVYAGEMKAVILGRAPSARIVDLFHSVSPQSILEGAFLLSKAWNYFPEKTVFVAVIDPGVGSGRRIIAVRAFHRTFLAPDNGLLSFIPRAAIEHIRAVENRRIFLPRVSNTFHGRDIFAPVAAALAKSFPFAKLGRRINTMNRLRDLYPVKSSGGWTGKIAHIDRFGNAVTNLPAGSTPTAIRISRGRLQTRVRTYADAPRARAVFLRGSFGTWEIAIRNGNAARRLNLRVGLAVRTEGANQND